MSEDMTESDWERLRGPSPPPGDELVGWGIDEWIEHFRRHDAHRNPILGAMASRPETAQGFSEAQRIAEEEDRLHEQSARKFHRYARDEDAEAVPEHIGELFEDEDMADEPWKASLPEITFEEQDDWQADREVDHEDREAECPASGASRDFLIELMDHLRDRADSDPILHYVVALVSSASVGLHMGGFWSSGEGYPYALTARYILSVERFKTVSRLLREHPELDLADLIGPADQLVADLDEAARERLGD